MTAGWNFTPPSMRHKDYPHTVYRLFDDQDTLLYVGLTCRDLHTRLRHHERHKSWWSKVVEIETAQHPDKASAIADELNTIETRVPPYNTMRYTR